MCVRYQPVYVHVTSYSPLCSCLIAEQQLEQLATAIFACVLLQVLAYLKASKQLTDTDMQKFDAVLEAECARFGSSVAQIKQRKLEAESRQQQTEAQVGHPVMRALTPAYSRSTCTTRRHYACLSLSHAILVLRSAVHAGYCHITLSHSTTPVLAIQTSEVCSRLPSLNMHADAVDDRPPTKRQKAAGPTVSGVGCGPKHGLCVLCLLLNSHNVSGL